MSSKLSNLVRGLAMLGTDWCTYAAGYPYTVGVTSAKPHDPERVAKAQAKRERKARRKAAEANRNESKT